MPRKWYFLFMLFIEGEPVPGLAEHAAHTIYGQGPAEGIASVVFNTSQLEASGVLDIPHPVMVLGMENTVFGTRESAIVAAVKPSSVITLGVSSNHAIYPNGTHLDVYLGGRAAEKGFLGLAVSKNFLDLAEPLDRSDVVEWIRDKIDGQGVVVSRSELDIHIILS